MDGIPCVTAMPNAYHVHAFIGMIVDGAQVALPDGAGMKGPGADGTFYGVQNWTEYASCYYYLHTHDASGVVHIESPQNAPVTASLYTLGNFFDVWGMPLSSSQVGPYAGNVIAYVAKVKAGTTQISRSSYQQYTGDLRAIPLYSHTSIWLETGPPYVAPAQLPVLNFYMEY